MVLGLASLAWAPGAAYGQTDALGRAIEEQIGVDQEARTSQQRIDRLDDETVHAIFTNMKQKQISAILPLMNPDKAVALTKLLGGRRSAPAADESDE